MRYAIALLLSATLSAPVAAATLDVSIENIRVQTGELRLAVYDSEAAWAGEAKAVEGRKAGPDGSDRLSFRFTDLAPGRYAVRVMHDENGNGKLDTNLLGIPKEGYGASNNPKVMRAPRFDEAAFEIADGDVAIVIALN